MVMSHTHCHSQNYSQLHEKSIDISVTLFSIESDSLSIIYSLSHVIHAPCEDESSLKKSASANLVVISALVATSMIEFLYLATAAAQREHLL